MPNSLGHFPFKLGKTKATRDPNDLKFTTYRNAKKLPTPPKYFGHEDLVKGDWGILGNDNAGDCVLAGAAHEHMLFCAEAGKVIKFNDKDVLSAYSAVTGFDPHAGTPDNNPTDQGTSPRLAMNYRRDTGIVDSDGNTHKIGAFVKLQAGNLDHLNQALYLFGVVGIGIMFPDSAMDQFDAGQPWKPVRTASIQGGHYVPLVALRKEGLVCVTWGKLQIMTVPFFLKYNDESWGILSEDALKEGKSLEGFDLAALTDDLNALGA